MKAILERCAGLDVHKKVIWVCVLLLGKDGKVKKFIRSFGAMTRDLLALSDFLAEHRVTDVAMESTGVYWKPVYNIAETALALLVRNVLCRTDDARSLLRELFTTEADLIPNDQDHTLTVRLHHLTNALSDRAARTLAAHLNEFETLYPGTNLRLIFKRVSDENPPCLEF